MIIKSTNKNIPGSNNAQIVKGVLQQQKARVESSLKKNQGQRNQYNGPIVQMQSPDQPYPQYQAQSEISKTQSHQVLIHHQNSGN